MYEASLHDDITPSCHCLHLINHPEFLNIPCHSRRAQSKIAFRSAFIACAEPVEASLSKCTRFATLAPTLRPFDRLRDRRLRERRRTLATIRGCCLKTRIETPPPAPPRRGEGSNARRAAWQVGPNARCSGIMRRRSRSFDGLADSYAGHSGKGFFSITMGANRTTGAFLRRIGGTDLFLSPSHRWTN